jgi:hypothetical protein
MDALSLNNFRTYPYFHETSISRLSAIPNSIFQTNDSVKNLIEFSKIQETFINSLSEDDKDILSSYTKHGDEIINNVLRGSATVKNIREIIDRFRKDRDSIFLNKLLTNYEKNSDNIVNFAQEYVRQFISVWKRVPTVSKPFKVFRGTNNFRQSLSGFISTTFYPYHMNSLFQYTNQKDCCIYELTINAGVRALMISPLSRWANENEILIDPTSLTSINKSGILKSLEFESTGYDGEKVTSTQEIQTYSGEINAGNFEYNIPGINRNVGVLSTLLRRQPYVTPTVKAGKRRSKRSKRKARKTRRR